MAGQWWSWYNNSRWRKLRRAQLQKAPLCKMCLLNNVATPATVVDHVVPHHGDWNSFWTGELQSLCKPHHDTSKRQIEMRGYSNEIGLDGWPIDPLHPANARAFPDRKNEKDLSSEGLPSRLIF